MFTQSWPRASIKLGATGACWLVHLKFGGHWGQDDVFLHSYPNLNQACTEAGKAVDKERRLASFNPRYKYQPLQTGLARTLRGDPVIEDALES